MRERRVVVGYGVPLVAEREPGVEERDDHPLRLGADGEAVDVPTLGEMGPNAVGR